MSRNAGKKSLFAVLAFLLTFSLLGFYPFQVQESWAASVDIDDQLTEAQRTIEETAQRYDQALEALEELELQIEENETRITELEDALPDQQLKSDQATIALYKMQSESYSLLDMLLGASSLQEFIASFEYISHVQEANLNEINLLISMKTELEETKESLESSRSSALDEKNKAETALSEAQDARIALQERAEEEAAAEAAAAEEAIRVAAAAAEAEAEAEDEAETEKASEKIESAPASSTKSEATTPNNQLPDIDWSDEKSSFVAQWAPRIDAYLAGSPLAGQGKAFATAAWNYGVDPRYSPAIANTESSKGLYCFKPYNAWGWGSSSWGSWEEAINAHVGGLARGYGYTITVEGSKKYCPPNWEHWYSSTLAQMNMI